MSKRMRNGQSGRTDRRASAGFTLVELLTVIAIIAILSAVVYPAASTVRVRAQENQVISNMKAIQASLQIYKQDEHGYPPTLGPVVYPGADLRTYAAMYPEWIRDRAAFHSPNNLVDDPEAAYKVDQGASVTRGYIAPANPNDTDEFIKANPSYLAESKMHGWDTMDGSVDKDTGMYVLHYSRYRTWDRGDPDYKRQLGYRNPPEDTVVTWNDTFVDWGDTGTADDRGDLLVLFLDGTVRKYNVRTDARIRDVNGQYWRLRP